uniref:Uncharacterized protein n=1 Tax=Ixodes ricinus TaxID=34613 RepID=A0A6B0UTG5_IXORI
MLRAKRHLSCGKRSKKKTLLRLRKRADASLVATTNERLFFYVFFSRVRTSSSKKKVFETDHDEQERWIHEHPRKAVTVPNPPTPTTRAAQNIGLAGTPTRRSVASTVLGQDRLPTTGWRAEWNMPARPSWTLPVL